ncbi:hypothetical protein BaRGS_00017273 [Batillaria attramentaria]|uniref:Ubiquitin carboxyl-terminal hydrolase n=1 Tax=Batillaria attramentaria TaxID=370345 RepID=A0ABD0KW41_9CAEN
MEGSVLSGNVLTNQNNSNPRTEAREMEKETEEQKGSADLSRTAGSEVPSSPVSLAQNTSAQHVAQEQTSHAETLTAVNDTSSSISVTDGSPTFQEQTAGDSSDKSDADSALSPKTEGAACATDGNGGPDSVAVNADTNEHQSEKEVARVPVTAASSSSASSSDTSQTQSQTETSGETEDASTGDPETESKTASQDQSPKLIPSLSSTSGQENSSASAGPSTSQTSSSQSAAATTSCSSVQSEEGAAKGNGQGESVYYIKWITFDGNKVPIITQNENGPCPLLAIMNVLLLKGKVRLAPMLEMVTSEQLMAYLGDCVFESMPQNLSETARANYEQNMQDAMAVMHKLQTGLDVNVRFTGVADFEYTPECIIFDLLEIGLYHGWLVDPQDSQSVAAVSKCSYNQLVEKIIQQKASDKDELIREALVAEQFLDRTASQLTYHGLCELSLTVKEHELSIFFRNNHFSTLYRHNVSAVLLC